eukprot:3945912-Prymnesium_polylepis.2
MGWWARWALARARAPARAVRRPAQQGVAARRGESDATLARASRQRGRERAARTVQTRRADRACPRP